MIFAISTPNGRRLSFEIPLESVISVKSLKLANFLKMYDFSMKDTERYSIIERSCHPSKLSLENTHFP